MANNPSLANGLENITDECLNVNSLDVSHCGQGDVVGRITKIFPNITRLGIGNMNLDDGGVRSIVTTYPGLTALNVGYSEKISGRGFELIADNCASLKELYVGNCSSPPRY